MPLLQQLCRIRISWLRAGHICLRRKLGLDEFAPRNVVARFESLEEPACTPLTKERTLNAVLSSAPRFLLEGGCSEDNPLVHMHVGVTLYEFEPACAGEGWLGAKIVEQGAENLFSEFIYELDNVAAHLAAQGQVTHDICWGSSVCFHSLWRIDLADETIHFLGFIDFARMPLGLFAEKPVGPVSAWELELRTGQD
jgi:hypothetical protein